MTETERNIAVIADIYAAFGRGDVPAILERLAPDVAWDTLGRDYGVPWLAPRRGRAEVAKFFESLAGLDMHHFAVRAVTGAGDVVVAIIDIAFTVKASGRRLDDPCEAHYWKLDAQGRVTEMHHIVDRLAHRAAA